MLGQCVLPHHYLFLCKKVNNLLRNSMVYREWYIKPSIRSTDHVKATSIYINLNLTFFTIIMEFFKHSQIFSLYHKNVDLQLSFISIHNITDSSYMMKPTVAQALTPMTAMENNYTLPSEESHSNSNNPTYNHHSLREQSRTYPWQKRGSQAA